jgi:hypothetical protein
VRTALAITTLGLLAAAGLAWNADDARLAGIFARVAAVFASIWLAHPALLRVDRRTIWLLVLGAMVLLVRPRSAIVVLPVIAFFVRTTQVRDRSADR